MKQLIKVLSVFIIVISLGFVITKLSIDNKESKTVILFSREFDKNIEVLDLSQEDINNDSEWPNKLKDFSNLKTVILGDNIIPIETKNNLEREYPKIHFDSIAIVNLYNQKIYDNAEIIDLSGKSVDSNIMDYLELFDNAVMVNLTNTNLTNREKIALREKFSNIKFVWDVLVLDMNVDSSIEEIDLSNRTDVDINSLKESLSLLPELKILRMNNTNLTNEELGSIKDSFSNVKVIWTIKFGRWEISTDTVAFSTANTNVFPDALKSEDIEVLKYCTDLKALDLGHNRITDISVIGNYLKELRILILADNKISDITPLANLKNLHYLELFMNNVTDFSALSSLKNLVDVNLCFDKIDDITPLLNLPKLERLWIVGCSVDNQMALLKSTYPNAQIVNYGYGSTDSGWRTHERYYAYMDMFKKKNYISDLFTKYDE